MHSFQTGSSAVNKGLRAETDIASSSVGITAISPRTCLSCDAHAGMCVCVHALIRLCSPGVCVSCDNVRICIIYSMLWNLQIKDTLERLSSSWRLK